MLIRSYCGNRSIPFAKGQYAFLFLQLAANRQNDNSTCAQVHQVEIGYFIDNLHTHWIVFPLRSRFSNAGNAYLSKADGKFRKYSSLLNSTSSTDSSILRSSNDSNSLRYVSNVHIGYSLGKGSNTNVMYTSAGANNDSCRIFSSPVLCLHLHCGQLPEKIDCPACQKSYIEGKPTGILSQLHYGCVRFHFRFSNSERGAMEAFRCSTTLSKKILLVHSFMSEGTYPVKAVRRSISCRYLR